MINPFENIRQETNKDIEAEPENMEALAVSEAEKEWKRIEERIDNLPNVQSEEIKGEEKPDIKKYEKIKKAFETACVTLTVCTILALSQGNAKAGEAGRYIERDAGRAVGDTLRGAGRGLGEGLRKSLEDTVMRAIGGGKTPRERERAKMERERIMNDYRYNLQKAKTTDDINFAKEKLAASLEALEQIERR